MSLLCKEWCVVVVVVLLGLFTTKCLSQSGTLCPRVSGRPSCVCQSSKGVIDLTPLANKDKPRFTDIVDPGDHSRKYTFNPCYKVKATEDCTSGYVCYEFSGDTSYEISSDKEEIYINTDGTPYLYYPTRESSVNVYLQCTDDEDPKIVSNGNTIFLYTLTLSSCQVCPGGCANRPSKKAAVTYSGYIGIAIILLFLILIAVYFIGGGIFLRVRKGPDSDLVPHKHFWKELPILIKDGCVLTFTGARSLLTCSSNRDNYTSIS